MRKNLFVLFCLAAACGAEPSRPASSVPASKPSTSLGGAAQARTVKRVVVALSRNSGTSITSVAPDGSVTVSLDIVENGRGPHTDASVRLAPDGTIASLEARGHHEMGTPVAETFSRQGARARWKSHEEDGSSEIKGSAFFMPVCDLPDALGWLARALLDAGGSMQLLPGGTATIEKTAEMTVKAGSEERRIVGYAITGLDLTPTHVWMNPDGTWFGTISSWRSVVPEGWEGVVDSIIVKQTESDLARDRKLAEKIAHKPPSAGLAFTHARVLDVERGRYLPDQTVVVIGDTIAAVGPSNSTKPPNGAEVVDLGGKALLPGLWEMHAHFADADGALFIASGVTTARDVANDPDKLDDWKKRYDNGTAVGPHMLRFGLIEGRGEKASSSKITAETVDEAKEAVDYFAKRGYEGIKIYNSMKPELVPLLAKEAHARGMMVTGHVPVHMLANEAVRAGYDGIEHVNMLFLNFFADHDTDTRTTQRFTLVGDKAANFDLRGKAVQDFFALLKEHDTVIDPTINVFEDLLLSEQGKPTAGLENLVERLPVQLQRTFLLGGLPLDGDRRKTYQASFEKVLEMVKRIYDAKLKMVVGTDSVAGLMLHHELALYVRAGISPAEVLRLDTIEAARAMKLDKKTGSIEKGKVADLFVVDGDPLARIEDLRAVVSTVRGGVVHASAPLYESVGVRPGLK